MALANLLYRTRGAENVGQIAANSAETLPAIGNVLKFITGEPQIQQGMSKYAYQHPVIAGVELASAIPQAIIAGYLLGKPIGAGAFGIPTTTAAEAPANIALQDWLGMTAEERASLLASNSASKLGEIGIQALEKAPFGLPTGALIKDVGLGAVSGAGANVIFSNLFTGNWTAKAVAQSITGGAEGGALYGYLLAGFPQGLNNYVAQKSFPQWIADWVGEDNPASNAFRSVATPVIKLFGGENAVAEFNTPASEIASGNYFYPKATQLVDNLIVKGLGGALNFAMFNGALTIGNAQAQGKHITDDELVLAIGEGAIFGLAFGILSNFVQLNI